MHYTSGVAIVSRIEKQQSREVRYKPFVAGHGDLLCVSANIKMVS